jgi:hypothetical protein
VGQWVTGSRQVMRRVEKSGMLRESGKFLRNAGWGRPPFPWYGPTADGSASSPHFRPTFRS